MKRDPRLHGLSSEERELFPACERVLDGAVLDAVAARSPISR
jgi:hypothetical protein